MNKAHPMDWSTLKSEYLFQDEWLTVRRETVQMPNGRTLEPFYALEYPDWVNVVAITPDDHIVMIRQWRNGIQKTLLEIPAGCVEPGEPPETAMRRELAEETGYTAETFIPTGQICPNPATHRNLSFSFLALNATRTTDPKLDVSEDIEVELIHRSRLPEILNLPETANAIQNLSLMAAAQHLGWLKWNL